MPQGLSLANFDAVLFDVDGTLVDSLGMLIPGLRDAITRFAGITPSDAEIQSLIGMPLREQIGKYLGHTPSDEELAGFTNYAIERYEHYKAGEKPFEAAINVLRIAHKKGKATVLVTSKNATELKLFLARFQAADAVTLTVCASDVQQPKPAPDSALLALAKLGVDRERAVMIGDSVYDIRCAKGAGIAVIAVGYGSATPDALMAEGPDLYLETPDDLLAWAEGSFQEDNAPQESTTRRFINDSRLDTAAGAA